MSQPGDLRGENEPQHQPPTGEELKKQIKDFLASFRSNRTKPPRHMVESLLEELQVDEASDERRNEISRLISGILNDPHAVTDGQRANGISIV